MIWIGIAPNPPNDLECHRSPRRVLAAARSIMASPSRMINRFSPAKVPTGAQSLFTSPNAKAAAYCSSSPLKRVVGMLLSPGQGQRTATSTIYGKKVDDMATGLLDSSSDDDDIIYSRSEQDCGDGFHVARSPLPNRGYSDRHIAGRVFSSDRVPEIQPVDEEEGSGVTGEETVQKSVRDREQEERDRERRDRNFRGIMNKVRYSHLSITVIEGGKCIRCGFKTSLI